MTVDSASVLLALGGAAAGISVGLLVYLLVRSASSVAPEDRAWRDPPPRAWRPLWWLARWLEPLACTLVLRRLQPRLASSLRQAGLDFAVTPAQYVAVGLAHGLMSGGSAVLAAIHWMPGRPVSWAVVGITGAVLGGLWPSIHLRDRVRQRRAELLRSLPFVLDIVTLCVEAGLNLQGAMAQAVAKGPPGALRDELKRCMRDIRAGKARSDALLAMAQRVGEPGLSQFVAAVVQAEALGMSLGPVLRAQADQRRTERFQRAEKLALQAPVKLLLPLIACIFPCTFIVLFFPIAMKLLQPGL